MTAMEVEEPEFETSESLIVGLDLQPTQGTAWDVAIASYYYVPVVLLCSMGTLTVILFCLSLTR